MVKVLNDPTQLKLISEEVLCRGRRATLIQRIYESGTVSFVKDVVRFGESVAIVPFINERDVILVKQFRASVNDWVLEIPAGRVEVGENIYEAARRELIEEVGYDAKTLVKVTSLYTSPGYSDEVLHLFVAKDLSFVGQALEPGELLDVAIVDLDKALKELIEGKVADAKTLLALSLMKIFGHVFKSVGL